MEKDDGIRENIQHEENEMLGGFNLEGEPEAAELAELLGDAAELPLGEALLLLLPPIEHGAGSEALVLHRRDAAVERAPFEPGSPLEIHRPVAVDLRYRRASDGDEEPPLLLLPREERGGAKP